MPLKSTSYRGGGMNWPNRSDVYSPRMSRCSDSFERSLRKYPSMPPEHSSEVFERLITYAMPRTSRSPRHSPQRETIRPKAYEEPCKYRPRAPEEDPTRDRRDDLSHLRESSKQAYAKHGDIRQIREMSRRLRKSLKTISSYSHMHTIATYLDGIDRDCDTPILETSETEHEDTQPAHEFSYPVNSTVQAAVLTTSLGVEAKPLPSSSQRTIAVPLSPTPSSRLTSGDILPVATTSLGVETKPLLIGRRTQIAIPLSPTPSSRCTGTDFANYFSASPPKTSLGVETIPSSISKRSIAVPLSPVSSKLTTLSDLPRLLITRSVQTFNFPGRTSDIDELEHLKYLIFKWMKRYDGEKNMEIVHHAVELMEMIKNIPVPTLSRSQDVLQKSISHLSCRNTKYGPGTSTDTSKNTVYNSRSDSSIHKHNVSQVSIAPSFLVIDGVPLINKQKNDSRRQKHKDLESRPVNQCNQPNMRYLIVKHDSDLSKDSKDNSQETLKHELLPKRTMSHIPKSLKTNEINNVHNSVSQSNSINREEHSSQDSFVSSKSQDDLHGFYSGMRCKDHNHEPGTSNNISQDGVNMSKLTTQKKHQKDSILENYVVHNVNNTNNRRYQREDITPKRNSLKSKKKFNKKQEKSNSSKMFISLDNADEEQNENYVNLNPRPDPAGLVTPVPTHSDKPSSAAAQLIAEWRPQPVFTLPPVGRPQLDQIHEEFKEYLKSWCEQIPIPDNTCDEKEIAGKSRLGILNGVWKMITKLKAQPAVFQNKFYYEDVLGKEIDGLLDCLPQTHELQEKKYSLKSQLLDKISDMNEVIKEIETPDNYKEVLANKAKIMKDKKGMFLRKTVRLDREPAEKIFEEMLKYCTLDDFLTKIDYKEPNKIVEKAYKNKLLPKIQAYMDELKEAHGKEMDELMDVYKESDILEQLETVPLPTEDEIKKDSEEILLGLEIEQWMNELPIIKSDDVNEQRQRVRLRDGLTKKIHDMGKRADISEYGEDTKVRHEISCFLDMVPLEKDQDLNINRMVDELTNRLKQRDGSGGRRKSVAFEDGTGYQQGYSSKLLNRSEYSFGPPGSGIYSPEGKLVQGDDETQYKSFAQNPPLCSTRIEQPGEWDDDAQYRAMFKDGVPCSSMIEPQAGYGPGSLPPDFKHSFPPPRQFNESALGGSFGYSRRGSEERHQYPDGMGIPMTPRSVPRSPGFHDSAAAMPKIPNDSEFVSLHGSSLQEAPRAFEQPQSVGWVPPEAPRYVSMRDSVPSQMSPRRFSNDPAFTQRSQIDPNISAAQEYMPMTRGGAQRVPQGFISMPSRRPSDIQPPSRYQSLPPNQFIPPQAFIPEESRFSRRSKASNDPSMRQELLDDSVGSSRGMTPQGPFEVSIQVHEPPRQYRQLDGADPFVSIVSQQRPNEFMDVRNRSAQNPPGIRTSPARDLNEIQNISSHQQARIPVPSPHASRNTPTDRITEASQPTSSQRGRLLASNAPSSEISNQPAFYSTPNQRSNLPPPNIRERRQLEKERGPARRLDMETEEEGEERCYCRQRFNKWRGQHCQSCDDCIQGRYYPYRPYPYQYMYPPMGPPPYPPHCRR
ncbi:uncharacterized protein LOC125238955 [Leguminivora glycinivorella]|uniref:uncharacterized protein LOC125238955 n=1 Tax=Leguminivora glycinivorella TaxID=1035111 RepID=UPI00200C9407|nr:uncharacterized protein LOC125238955 [Leguminivora glycinivorella]